MPDQGPQAVLPLSWACKELLLWCLQVLADVGTGITLLIRQFQYLSEKNFHGKS